MEAWQGGGMTGGRWDEDVVVVPARAANMITGRDWFFLLACLALIAVYRNSFLVTALVLWLVVQLALWTWAALRTRGHELRLSREGFERLGGSYRVRVPWEDIYRLEHAGGWGDKYWVVHHADHPLLPAEGLDAVPAAVQARADKFGLDHQTALAMFTKDPRKGPFAEHLRRYNDSVLAELEREKRSR